LEIELSLFWEAIMQLTAAKEADEKAKKIAEDLQRECLAFYFYLCSVERMLSIQSLFCRVSAPGTRAIPGL